MKYVLEDEYWEEMIRASVFGFAYKTFFSVREVDGDFVSIPLFMLPDEFDQYYDHFIQEQLNDALLRNFLTQIDNDELAKEKPNIWMFDGEQMDHLETIGWDMYHQAQIKGLEYENTKHLKYCIRNEG